MDKETESNLDQWVSEFPNSARTIRHSALTHLFGRKPPLPKEDDAEWSYLKKMLSQ
jgi:hypothetical protein